MKLLVIVVFVVFLSWLSGCGAVQQQQQPGVQADRVRTPYVLVLGDDLVTSWGTPEVQQTHPMWTFAGPLVGTQETSGSALARLPALLKVRHYDVVVLATGTEDIQTDPSWNAPCGYGATVPAQTCLALSQMAVLIHAVEGKVLISTIPYTDDQSTIPIIDIRENKLLFDYGMRGTGYPLDQLGQDGVNDIQAALAGTTWSDDDVLFNPAGALAATSVTELAISKLSGDWGNK